MSLDHLDEIAGDIARWEYFSKKFLKDYFKMLKFDFSADYQRGLLAYLKMAVRIGALKRVPRLRFAKTT